MRYIILASIVGGVSGTILVTTIFDPKRLGVPLAFSLFCISAFVLGLGACFVAYLFGF